MKELLFMVVKIQAFNILVEIFEMVKTSIVCKMIFWVEIEIFENRVDTVIVFAVNFGHFFVDV